MNSRERVFAVLEGRVPDRVPVMEMFIDPKVIDSIYPEMHYADFIDYADMDIVTCLTMADDPENINWVDKNKGLWKDKWGVLQKLTGETVSILMPPGPIESEADLQKYHPPDPVNSPVYEYAQRLIDRFKGKRAIAVVGEATFAPQQYLRGGLSELMIDYALRPEFVDKVAQIGVEYYVPLYQKLITQGVEIVILGDDYAGKSGPFMSPEHFERFILPGLTTVVRAIKDSGGYVIKHCDGDIWKIMDMMVSTGIDMFGPLESPHMNLAEVLRATDGSVGVVGNVDVDLLSRGTVDEVVADTQRVLQQVAHTGHHILSSGNSISSSVKGENFMAMLTAAKEFNLKQPSMN